MAVRNQCLYRKFGHCKFLETGKYRHIEKICENSACEIENCESRHPRDCRFYREFGRCKFGVYCSFKHKTSTPEFDDDRFQNELEGVKNELETTKAKVATIEQLLNDKNREIQEIRDNLVEVVRKQETDTENLRKTIIEATEQVVKEATEAVVFLFDKSQENTETLQSKKFDSLETQLASLFSLLETSRQNAPKPPQPTVNLQTNHDVSNQPLPNNSVQSSDSRNTRKPFPCKFCRQGFDLERALRNHIRTVHEEPPNQIPNIL